MNNSFRDKISEFIDRPGLARMTRHLCWITSILAVGNEETLENAIVSGLRDSVSPIMIREAILQSYLFTGYPRVINGLFLLRDICDRLEIDYSAEVKPSEDYSDWATWRERGESLCRRVYGRSYERLQERIKGIHPLLARWMIVEGYGKVLSHEGLPVELREMLVISVLVSQEAWRQLHSHLLGGLHLGISPGEIREIMLQLKPVIPVDRIKTALKLFDELEARRVKTDGNGR